MLRAQYYNTCNVFGNANILFTLQGCCCFLYCGALQFLCNVLFIRVQAAHRPVRSQLKLEKLGPERGTCKDPIVFQIILY